MDLEDGTAEFLPADGEFEILSGLDGGVEERKFAYANFATRAERMRIDSASAAVSRFGMLEAAIVATTVGAAEVVIVDDVARISLDESSTIAAITVDCSRAARFG